MKRKLLFLPITLLLIIGIGLLVYFAVFLKKETQVVSNVFVSSDASGYDIEMSTENKADLALIIKEYQIDSRGVASVKNVDGTVQYSPLNKLSLIVTDQPQSQYFIRGKDELASVGQTYDQASKTLTIYVYPTPQAISAFPDEALNTFISTVFIRAIYYNSIAPNLDLKPTDINANVDFNGYIERYEQEQKSFINIKPNALRQVIKNWTTLVIKPTYAIDCTGSTYELGVLETVRTCSNNSSIACNTNLECNGGTCVASSQCRSTGARADCRDNGLNSCIPTNLGNCDNGTCSAPTNPTGNCPANTIQCGGGCGCMPNTQTCNFWIANNCGNGGGGGGGGGGGSCASGGDCFQGISNCGQVGRPVQTGACTGGLCCAFGGGTPGCQLEVQQWPSTIQVGQTLPYRIFERGGVGVEGFFSYDMRTSGGQNWPSWMTTITPMSQSGSAIYTGTVTGVQAGFTKVQFATRIDWTRPIQCRRELSITVTPAACVPNCGAQLCGQANGCGGNCSTASVPAPLPPATISPSGSVTPVGGQITVSWTASTRATSYQYEIYPQGGSCASPEAFCGSTTNTSVTFTVSSSVSTYVARVRAVNAACNGVAGNVTTFSPYTQTTFTTSAGIAGNFYLDNNRTCTVSGSTPLTGIGTGGSVTVTDRNNATNPATISATGYSATVPYWTPGGNNVVTVRPGVNTATGAQLTCACNANGSDTLTCVRSGINSPQAGVNFFLTDRLPVESWFQVINGSIYAGATNAGSTGIRSYVPTNCTTPGCAPFVLRQDTTGSADSAGVGVTGGSGIDTDSGGGNNRAKLTQRTPTTVGATGTTMARREDYAYFTRQYDVVSTDPTNFNDFDGSPGRSPAANATKPTLAPRSGKAGYITNGDLTISQPWIVNSNEKIVVFVPGNLYINDPSSVRTLITVAQGGFLAFIVQGNIVINSNVGYPSPYTQTAPNIEGVFIANGTIDTSANGAGPALRLVGAGNFVGWGGVSMQRNLGLLSGFNETFASESFSSRPDFVKNVPTEMTSSSSTWQEVN